MAKRDYGTGSVREVGPGGKPQPGSGRWQIRTVRIHGKQYTKTVRGTEREARRELGHFEQELLGGSYDGKRPPAATEPAKTFGDLLTAWLEDGAGRWAPETLRKHQERVKKHIRPALGDSRLTDLVVGDLDRLYASLRLAPSTVRQVHQEVQLAREYGARNRMPTPNVQGKPRLPKLRNKVEHVIVTPEQIRAILARAEQEDSSRAPAMYLLAYNALRAGEVCALRWSDLDLDADPPTLTLARSVTKQEGVPVEKSTKSDKVTVHTVGPLTAERLRQHRAAAGGSADDLLFPRKDGRPGPITPGVLLAYAKKVEEAVGVFMDEPCHGFRHAYASNAQAAGFDMAQVSKRLTHANIGITLSMYTQATDKGSQELAAAVESL